MIDQLAQFIGIAAAEIFFEPLQLRLELADLLEQLSFLGLALGAVFSILARGEQLIGAIQELAFSLAFLNGVISGNLLDRLATTNASMATLALNSGLWVHRLLIGGRLPSGTVPRLRG